MKKNFRIEDEQGIVRDAELITIIDVEGKEYAIYSIERDEENTNIFVSGIEKGIDGKSKLVDITDAKEKEELDEITKEIIKLSLSKEN